MKNTQLTINEKSEKLRSILAQGWTGMMFVFFMMITYDLYSYGIVENLPKLGKDLGNYVPLMQIFCFNIFMQISIRTFNTGRFKWFTFIASIGYSLFFVWHQVYHILNGEPTISIHTYLDTTHHILGIWSIITAYKWARLEE